MTSIGRTPPTVPASTSDDFRCLYERNRQVREESRELVAVARAAVARSGRILSRARLRGAPSAWR